MCIFQAYGENARDRTQRLCQVLNLFSWTVMAVLDRGVASEAVVLSILPMLLKGLKSSFVPFRSAAYGILLKLMYKTPLDSKLLERIANSLCKVSDQDYFVFAILINVYNFVVDFHSNSSLVQRCY